MRVCVTLPVDELDKVAACVDETVREEVPVIDGELDRVAACVDETVREEVPVIVGEIVGVAP